MSERDYRAYHDCEAARSCRPISDLTSRERRTLLTASSFAGETMSARLPTICSLTRCMTRIVRGITARCW